MVSQRYEWCNPGIEPQIERSEMQNLPLDGAGFEEVFSRLEAGGIVHGRTDEFTADLREELDIQGVRSMALVPIFASDRWWGFFGFDDCVSERDWTRAEIEALRAAAGILGSAIHRREVEAGRHEAEERYRTLVDASPIAIVVVDTDDRVTLWNEAAERTYGWIAEEVLGRRLPTLPESSSTSTRCFARLPGRATGSRATRRAAAARTAARSTSACRSRRCATPPGRSWAALGARRRHHRYETFRAGAEGTRACSSTRSSTRARTVC